MSRLPPLPDLEWRDDGAPYARAFGDIYFSSAGGLSETEAVFHAGCDLPNVWRGRDRFAICELGFGTGLNALATWRLWRRAREKGARLHFVSIEAQPMTRDDAARALAAFPELSDLSALLLARWPVRAYAPQRIAFDDDGFALTLLIGDAAEMLDGIIGSFDAFFLDGFSPARNAEMWSARIARRIAALSAPGARVATYSVAAQVRGALQSAGFEIAKKPGFAGKRERLEAVLTAPPSAVHALYPYGGDAPKRVAIVGGGVAGACVADAVIKRGAHAVIFEAGDALASGASGNPAGLVMPRLDRGRAPAQELNLAAFIHAVNFYRTLGALHECGAIEFARDDLIRDPPLPSEWLRAEKEAVRHVKAGVISPRAAIAKLTSAAELRLNTRVARIEEAGGALRLTDGGGDFLGEYDAIVIANGATLDAFAQTKWLTLRRTAGQVETARPARLAHALAGESYAAPLDDGIIFGATFDRIEASETVESEDARARNLDALAKLSPALAAELDRNSLRSRASVRVAAPDYVPIAGLLPRAEEWLAQQAGLAHGRAPDVSKQAPAHRGVYVIGGLSARGLTLAPLLADRIVSEMFLEPQSLQAKAVEALHPARFLHRMLKKGLTMPASVKNDGEDSFTTF